jgi:hypothetical protein
MQKLGLIEQDTARCTEKVLVQKPHYSPAGHGFAAAGLAQKHQTLSAAQGKGQIANDRLIILFCSN